jgi:hypothetical protein
MWLLANEGGVGGKGGQGAGGAGKGGQGTGGGSAEVRRKAALLLQDTMPPHLIAKVVGYAGPVEGGEGGWGGSRSEGGGGSREEKMRVFRLQRGSLWASGALGVCGGGLGLLLVGCCVCVCVCVCDDGVGL